MPKAIHGAPCLLPPLMLARIKAALHLVIQKEVGLLFDGKAAKPVVAHATKLQVPLGHRQEIRKRQLVIGENLSARLVRAHWLNLSSVIDERGRAAAFNIKPFAVLTIPSSSAHRRLQRYSNIPAKFCIHSKCCTAPGSKSSACRCGR